MNRLFFLILFAVGTANYTFSQNQITSADKKTIADTGKDACLMKATGSQTNASGTCVLDMRKSTVTSTDTTGKQLLKSGNPAQGELYPDNSRIIATPPKDEK